MSIAEFHAALKLSRSSGQKAGILIGRAVLAYWCVHMVAATLFSAYRRDYQVTAVSATVFLVTFGIVCIALRCQIRTRRAIAKQWQDGGGCFATTKGRISHLGIHLDNSDSPAMLEWSTFTGYRVSKEIVILYGSAQCPNVIVARSKFRSDGDWQVFVTMVRTRLHIV